MALRRPTLLVCILTIVLGLNFEITPRPFPGARHVQDGAQVQATVGGRDHAAVFAPCIEKERQKARLSQTSKKPLTEDDTRRERGAPSLDENEGDVGRRSMGRGEVESGGQCCDGSPPKREEVKEGRAARPPTCCQGRLPENLPPKHKLENKTRALPSWTLPSLTSWSWLTSKSRNWTSSAVRSLPSSLATWILPPLTLWSLLLSNMISPKRPLFSPAADAEPTHPYTPSLLQTAAIRPAKYDLHVPQDPKNQPDKGVSQVPNIPSEEDGAKTYVKEAHSDKRTDFSNAETALPCADYECPCQHQMISHEQPSKNLTRKGVFLSSGKLGKVRLKAIRFPRKIEVFGPNTEETYFSEHAKRFSNVSLMCKWKNSETHLKRETNSRSKHQLTLVCLCITLMIFRNEDLKQAIAPLMNACKGTTNIRKLIQEFLQRITETGGSKKISPRHNLDKPAVNRPTVVLQKGKVYSFLNKNNSFKPRRAHGTHDLVDDEKTEEPDAFLASHWLRNLPTTVPRPPMTYTVFPASFLPSVASNDPSAMSYLGYRLASLSSLPASCPVSRVRLAQSGFYYDNSKTHRDATDAHTMTCYSCGVSYSQWKKGDNPDKIHQQLRPGCQHLKESSSSSNNSNDPNRLSSVSTNGNLSMAPSSASSGYFSMNGESLGASRTLSSDFASSADNSSTMVSGENSALKTAASSNAQTCATTLTYTDSANNNPNDLATDCAAIVPTGGTSAALSTSQGTTSGPARDTASAPPSSHSFPVVSGGFSSLPVQGLDDRPPVSMAEAVYPQFSRLQDRRVTFSGWPQPHIFEPEDLIMQGFYYAGYADCIRCFYCGVGLKSWSSDDDVMVEHIRWRPSCGYILNTKGRRYVQTTLDRIQASLSEGQNSQRAQQNPANPGTAPATNHARQASTAAPQTQSATTSTPSQTRSSSASASAGNAPASGNSSLPAPKTSSSAARSSASSASVAAAPAPSSRTASASPSTGGSGDAASERRLLEAVGEMGFERETIIRALRQLQLSGVSSFGVDELVEKVFEISADEVEDGETNAEEHNGELQTDGAEEDPVTRANEEQARRLVSENERLRDRNRCKICKKAKVGMIFLPCRHLAACVECGGKVRYCSVCGQFIKATANVYI